MANVLKMAIIEAIHSSRSQSTTSTPNSMALQRAGSHVRSFEKCVIARTLTV